MSSKAAKQVTPVDKAQKFLQAHDEVSDLRLHALLLFNAFETTLREMLAWRLSCPEDALPKAVSNNASLLIETTLGQFAKPKEKAQKFLAARNAVAHHFHDEGYEAKLGQFVKATLERAWPTELADQQKLLSEAVWMLALEFAVFVDETPNERGDFPFPQLLADLSNRKKQ